MDETQEKRCCPGSHSHSCCRSGGRVFIGRRVPDFSATAVMPDGTIDESFELASYLGGGYGFIFFYPLDFTFVCPSEIIAFSNRINAFTSRNTKVVGISVDSHFTHTAWRAMPYDKGGVGEVKFPLVADLTKSIARDYGVLMSEKGVALRGAFLVDRDMILRHMTVNDLPLGRNVDEALRMVDALEHFETNGEVCPAGWNKNREGMRPTSEGVASFLARHASKL